MKSVIIAAVILCSVTASVIWAAVYSGLALDKLVGATEEVSIKEGATATGIEEVEAEYRRVKPFLSLFACDSEAREIELYIEDIKSASLENDAEALLTAKSRLILHIKQLRRLSGFSIEAVF